MASYSDDRGQVQARWLRENRQHRMDALDASDIFSRERQTFHRARYEFAEKYVTDRDVADIACGLGYGSRILAGGAPKTILGIDLSRDATRYARTNYGGEHVRFVAADAASLPLRSSIVDIVTSFETIEHVPNTEALLSEFARVLRSDGVLIVSSPNDWGLTDHHCHSWTPFEFMAEVNDVFAIESVWEQYSDNRIADEKHPLGIKPWSRDTEAAAECLVIVARNQLRA